jgi:predicted trehalose synthase
MKSLQTLRHVVFFVCLTIGISIFIGGCATKQKDVLADYSTGKGVVSKVYHVNQTDGWIAATTLMRWSAAEELQENRSAGYMTGIVGREGQKSRSVTAALWGPITAFGMNSYGSYVGIWIEPISASEIKISVVSRNTVVDQPQTGPKADEVHAQLGKILDLMATGKPLPDAPPADIVSQKN